MYQARTLQAVKIGMTVYYQSTFPNSQVVHIFIPFPVTKNLFIVGNLSRFNYYHTTLSDWCFKIGVI